jgi:hypothetical protein
MKTWVKCYVFLAGLACAASVLAAESTPITDVDAFEKQYLECIMGGVKNDCITALFKEHAPLGAKPENIEKSMVNVRDSFQKFLKGTNVFKIHVVDKKLKAGIYDDRIYLIETANTNLLCFRVVFRKILDKWYIAGFQLSDEEKVIIKLMDLNW